MASTTFNLTRTLFLVLCKTLSILWSRMWDVLTVPKTSIVSNFWDCSSILGNRTVQKWESTAGANVSLPFHPSETELHRHDSSYFISIRKEEKSQTVFKKESISAFVFIILIYSVIWFCAISWRFLQNFVAKAAYNHERSYVMGWESNIHFQMKALNARMLTSLLQTVWCAFSDTFSHTWSVACFLRSTSEIWQPAPTWLIRKLHVIWKMERALIKSWSSVWSFSLFI